ncbi:MAG: phosphate ABC transporter permease subunit PstC [Candidatus Dadabacteria bacterium]
MERDGAIIEVEVSLPISQRAKEVKKNGRLVELIFKTSLGFWAIFLGVVFPISAFFILAKESWLSIKRFGFGFITGTVWDPVALVFGGLPAIYGTLLITFLAVLIATPVSIGISIFITELVPKWLKPIVTGAVELLAAIPSIIYGMCGFFVFVPFVAKHVEPFLIENFSRLPVIGFVFNGIPSGIDAFTTSIVLSVMIIPFMASVTKDSFNMVPSIVKESAYGLGATKWEVMRKVVIPYTASGIAGGLILAIGRALGETMAVTFLAGNNPQIPKSLFEPLTTITVALANQFTEADTDLYLSSLYYLAIILFVISFLVLVTAKLMVLRLEKQWKVKQI